MERRTFLATIAATRGAFAGSLWQGVRRQLRQLGASRYGDSGAGERARHPAPSWIREQDRRAQ